MKKLLLLSILALVSLNLTAQESHFGAKLSGSFTTLTASGDDASDWNDHTTGKYNLEFGLVGEFILSNQLSIAPEINYAGEGDVYEYGELELTVSTSYIQVPVMVKYYINNNFNFNFGPQVGFLLSADGETELTIDGTSSTISEDIKDNFNSTEFGLNIGAGYKFENGMFLDFRYYAGLSDLLKDSTDGNLKSKGLKLGIGYFFK